MLSKLIPSIDFMDHAVTGIVSKKQPTPSPGEEIKLHIPELMTKIPFAEAQISTLKTKGQTIFLNDPSCRPSVRSTLKEQNYLTVKCGKNANWDGIDTVVKDGNGRIVYRALEKDQDVQCQFLSGILTHGIVETRRDMESYDGGSKAENTSMIYSGDIGHVYVSDPEQIGVLSAHVDDLVTKLQDSKILGEK